MLLTSALAVSVFLSAPPQAKPVALILHVEGEVEIRPVEGKAESASIRDLVFPGERLFVPTGGTAILVILGIGVQEHLRPGVEVTVGISGCTPPAAVILRKQRKSAISEQMKEVRPAPGE